MPAKKRSAHNTISLVLLVRSDEREQDSGDRRLVRTLRPFCPRAWPLIQLRFFMAAHPSIGVAAAKGFVLRDLARNALVEPGQLFL